MRLDVDKRTDNTEPRSICFLPQYAKLKKIFILAHDQDSGTKKQQALSITFYYIDIDEIPGFLLLLKNHIFTARSERIIFIFHM